MQIAASWQLLKNGKMSLFVVFWGFCFCICFFPPGASFLPQGGAEQGVAGSRGRIRQLMAPRGESSAKPRVNLERGRILPLCLAVKIPNLQWQQVKHPLATTLCSHPAVPPQPGVCKLPALFLRGVPQLLGPRKLGTGPASPGGAPRKAPVAERGAVPPARSQEPHGVGTSASQGIVVFSRVALPSGVPLRFYLLEVKIYHRKKQLLAVRCALLTFCGPPCLVPRSGAGCAPSAAPTAIAFGRRAKFGSERPQKRRAGLL